MTTANHKPNGMLLVISGPSGVGKTTITRQMENNLGGVFSVSITTRPKSDADTEGHDYYFVDRAEFKRRCNNGEMLEWAEVFGQYYGTPRRAVLDALGQGKLVLLEIDVAGAIQVKRKLPDAFAIFVEPPGEQELLERLRRRQREDESVIQRRFKMARQEIERARSCDIYDRFIINDKLSIAVQEALDVVKGQLAHREVC